MTNNITGNSAASSASTGISTELLVTGMTCSHCVASVTEEVSEIAGVLAVSVDLKPAAESRVTVTSAHPLDPEAVRAAITEAGYDLVSLR
jgi:copper chaperone